MEANWWVKYDYRDEPHYRVHDEIRTAVDNSSDTEKDVIRMVLGIADESNLLERTQKYNATVDALSKLGIEIGYSDEVTMSKDPNGEQGYINAAVMTLFVTKEELRDIVIG